MASWLQVAATGGDGWPGSCSEGRRWHKPWDGATAAEIIKLDLMQTDRGFLDDLVAFLAPRAGSRRVMISSRGLERAAVPAQPGLPGVTMVFSVAGPDAVHQLKSDPALQSAIGGVSAF